MRPVIALTWCVVCSVAGMAAGCDVTPFHISTPADGGGTFENFKQDAERVFILQNLREHDWNVSETARALAMPRSNLYKKIEKYQLTRESR